MGRWFLARLSALWFILFLMATATAVMSASVSEGYVHTIENWMLLPHFITPRILG
jgi:hypothetical protein